MHQPVLDILVMADLHHTGAGDVTPADRDHLRTFRDGPLFVRKALLRMKHEGVNPGLIAVLGDLVDDGLSPAAEQGLSAMAEELKRTQVPFIVVPGNHDGAPERVDRIFGSPPGLREIGGFGFLVFHDRYSSEDRTWRTAEQLQLPAAIAGRSPDLPLIALQHNPLHPRIDADYPYNPDNSEDILASYRRGGVLLSLSGHFHAGQPLHDADGVQCYTAPSACETPYRFAHVHLEGRSVSVREIALHAPIGGLVDAHCHTELAYCGSGVAAGTAAALARTLGLKGLCFTEHAFQLYLPAAEAWKWKWQTDPDLARRAFDGEGSRMAEYRRLVRRLPGDLVRAGLEVDLLNNGELFLAEEDRSGWNLLVGAIHAINGSTKSPGGAGGERLFMREIERLVQHPIQVLAHPFRFLLKNNVEPPIHLYDEMAALLAERGVAAEINFHTQTTDCRFVEACVSRGVKLALGSDSHTLAQVGELTPHLRVLRDAGIDKDDFSRVLFAP